jgi:hypothetical protein
MSEWFDFAATVKILVFGLLVGALLPGLFAVGMRVSAGGGAAGAPARKPVLVALSWVIYALVLAAVVTGVLFIARDFIGHHTGWYLLGATPT